MVNNIIGIGNSWGFIKEYIYSLFVQQTHSIVYSLMSNTFSDGLGLNQEAFMIQPDSLRYKRI